MFISIEFFLILIFFIFFSLQFFFKKFLSFFNKKEYIICYKKFFKKNYIYINFLLFWFYDFPKKWSFYYFYNFFKFLNQKEKIKLNFLFTDYKLIFKVIKLFFLKFLFKLLTTFSYLAYENTNYIYKEFIDSKIISKNIDKKIIFKIFLLNLLVNYNNIFLKIKKKKVIISCNVVIFNPKIPKIKPTKNLIKEIFEKTEKNVGINDISYSSKICIKSYGTSNPNIVVTIETNDTFSINQILNKSNNSNFNHIKMHLDLKKEIELKSNPFYEKLNKKFKTFYSGYDEKKDFKNCLEIFSKSHEKEFNDILSGIENYNINNKNILENFEMFPIHIVEKSNENHYDVDEFEVDLDDLVENKLIFAQTLTIFWNQEIYKHDIIDGKNLLLSVENYIVRDYFLQNFNKFDLELQNIIDSIDIFYKSNPNLYLKEGYEDLKETVEDHVDNIFTKSIWKATKKFEKSDNILDSQNVLNFFDDFVQNIFKK